MKKWIQLSFDFKPWDDEEIWKDIKHFEGYYQVSNWGRVRSFYYRGLKRKVPKILKPCLHHNGYLKVCLFKNGKQKTCLVHKLVWEAFNGKVPEGYEINHISEDKTENRLSNLNLLSHKANLNWGTHNERMSKTKRVKWADRVSNIVQKNLQGEVIKIWASLHEIERELGYSNGNICLCCRGRKYHNTAYGYIWEYTKEKATA